MQTTKLRLNNMGVYPQAIWHKHPPFPLSFPHFPHSLPPTRSPYPYLEIGYSGGSLPSNIKCSTWTHWTFDV